MFKKQKTQPKKHRPKTATKIVFVPVDDDDEYDDDDCSNVDLFVVADNAVDDDDDDAVNDNEVELVSPKIMSEYL